MQGTFLHEGQVVGYISVEASNVTEPITLALRRIWELPHSEILVKWKLC